MLRLTDVITELSPTLSLPETLLDGGRTPAGTEVARINTQGTGSDGTQRDGMGYGVWGIFWGGSCRGLKFLHSWNEGCGMKHVRRGAWQNGLAQGQARLMFFIFHVFSTITSSLAYFF